MSSRSFKMLPTNYLLTNHIFNIYIYIYIYIYINSFFVLNILQWLICHKTQSTIQNKFAKNLPHGSLSKNRKFGVYEQR